MQNFDVIIIGGGLGGLTAGATLSKQGKKVLLLEQHYIAGGCATTFKRKNFVMEVGLHEMDGLFEKDLKQDIFQFLKVDKNVDFIQVPELFRVKGKQIDFVHPHGYEQSLVALIERFPKEEKGIRNFLAFMDRILVEIQKFPIQRWKQLLMYPILPLTFPSVVKSSRISLGDWLDKNIRDNELKIILQANLLYYNDNPYTMSMTYFSAAQASYISGGGHFVKGGSQKLSNYLKDVIEQNEGQVLLGKQVNKIITENGKAIGIAYQDTFNQNSSEVSIYAEAIIANAAIPLVKNLLPVKESKKLGHKIDHLKTSCALLSIYIGFKKEPKELGNQHYSTFILGDNVNNLQDIGRNNRGDWEHKSFVFVDYGQIDSELTTKGKSIGVICAADYLSDWDDLDKETYANKKEEVAQILFDRLEKEIPGIKEQIEYYEVGTAKTVQRFTLNPEGTAYGFAQTPKQSGMVRTPLKSPIKNLYFAGAWTFPGGGFTGAIISGFLCGNTVNNLIPNKKGNDQNKIVDHRIVKLIAKKEISKNTVEISLEKPKDFRYIAGQYSVVEILNPKEQKLDVPFRSLSMVSHPDESTLKFAMRFSESSFKKNINNAKIGDQFRVFGPMGHFVLSTPRKGIVFLISGIGITPIIPFLKELDKTNFDQPIYLFYTNRTEKDTAYHEFFQSINLPLFHYIPIFTQLENRIDKNLLQTKLKNIEEFDYYLVGTGGFVKSMKNILLSNNVANENIKIDDFG